MQATADSLAFAPPPEPAAVRGFFMAAVAHILLLVALAWGITWDKDTTPAAVEAELWSAMPQEAAPPPPPPQPAVQAPPVVQAPPPPVVQKAPDIAIEREKKRKEEEARRREEEEQHRKLVEAQKKKQQLEEQKRQREEQARLAKEQAAKEKEKEKAKQELDAKKREQIRKEQIARSLALAAGGGPPSAQGNAPKSSSRGMSDSYGARIRARVKPNIVFTDDVPGNPSAEVEVRMAPDGTIVARKITKSSGVKSWDDAVLRALDKTEVLPRDVDGRVPPTLIIEFKLRG
jgi:colicin import membrane protein